MHLPLTMIKHCQTSLTGLSVDLVGIDPLAGSGWRRWRHAMLAGGCRTSGLTTPECCD